MDRLVWIDCEMTGLDPAADVLLEVACLVTDSELNVVGDGVDLVIAAPEAALDAMVPVVKDMHATSGLSAAVRTSTLTVAEAERQVLDYVRTLVPESRRAPLCGNSIATDRTFLARYMPQLDAYLHYRMIDVSSVKELARRWYPRAYYAAPVKRGGHRALADIRESIEELRYYRQTVFVPPPGPTTDDARAAAQSVRAETDAASSAPPPSTNGAPPAAATPAADTPPAARQTGTEEPANG
ncbi:oligoribonuclease [Frankia sp. CNm7]|uniref:Oligoribonuclease n=1 Tax=Frankia nepalensis TaxID=1836974 RepID=A0A937RUL4_9ACTN|nr:oligoribonuclease [Frankia nepalensis]MBL7502378.1 oligoribonuclease [Frankia nepalensis]MBL7511617.1 oligoribonuclease [Frankia nepalensis]MBL7520146.1 oligoribonuclease [Frankia nepalensis]MBL7633609.1 oligoribonuclease [Frankia nepalensis]